MSGRISASLEPAPTAEPGWFDKIRIVAISGLLDVRDNDLACAMSCFSDTVPDPTTDAVDAGVRAFLEGNHDGIWSAWAAEVQSTPPRPSACWPRMAGTRATTRFPTPIPKASPPHIAIPATAGTGSEVTRFTVITDSARDEKMLIAGASLIPSAAVLDYELNLCRCRPASSPADTGTDALTHCIEAYVSRKANRFTDTIALAAMKTIWAELPRAYREPDNRAAREAMMQAATFAGIAFSNASVALVHGMSRPLGVFFHVPHGLSNAMLLPAVTAFSVASAADRYADCARAMGIATGSDSTKAAVARLIEALFERNARIGGAFSEEVRHFREAVLRSHPDDGRAGAGLRLASKQSSRTHRGRNRRALSRDLEVKV